MSVSEVRERRRITPAPIEPLMSTPSRPGRIALRLDVVEDERILGGRV
jgi:hypothetical protein